MRTVSDVPQIFEFSGVETVVFRSVARYVLVLHPASPGCTKTPRPSLRSGSWPLAGSHPTISYINHGISFYMNNKVNSPDTNAGKTKRKKLPPEAVRSCTVTTKMTAAEREKIHAIAAKCNLTPSDYMRQRALGYEPPSALTAEESALLHNLDGCRVDILNFANALAGMKQDKRIILFQKVSFMLDWYRQVVPITNAVTEFLNSVINGGRLSPRTRKTITKA